MIGWIVIVATALAATPADAHSALPGIEGFYAGLLHPVLVPAHLMLLLALGLWLGARHRRAGVPVWALAAMLAFGLGLSGAGLSSSLTSVGVLAAATVVGGAVALAVAPPGLVTTTLAAISGFLVGIDTDVGAASPSGWAGLAPAALGGAFIGAMLIALNAMALASVADRPPFTIAVRVAGSWIAAAAVMVLALHVKGLGGAT